ncbi:putative cytochrome P450 [Helianthus annuus]|uniref:Cytochrome P450 n=1 Tax=Helianthus annuus TaxID=4232 RepID=A0A251V640_HELAN|nr:costunolide synthase [Helianthus annuus]KAF5812959.1 putative cytochrome P450 [Helianthus annuus]
MEPLIIFTLIACSLVFLFTAYWALLNFKTTKNLPPGPPKLPIIGNIHQLKGGVPHRVLRSLARKYGPIMYLQLGQVPTVVISTPKLAQEIFKTNDVVFSDRPTTIASQILFYKAQDIAWAPYGSYWRQMRKICTLELLSAKRVRSYSFIRDEEIMHMRKSLKSSAGRPLVLRDVLVQLVNDVICRATVGDICKDRSTLIDVLFDIMRAVTSFNMASNYPRLQFLNVISGKQAKWLKRQKQLDIILEDILEDHKNNRRRGDNDQEDLVDVLLRIKEKGDLDQPITNDNIKGVILDMLIGGTSTSSMTLEWAMVELMRKPEILRKAQTEVRATAKGNTIADTDIQNMLYLKMIIKETFRLHGPPILVPRVSRKDCMVDRYNIPVNTRILINAWACGTDPDSWENPDSFVPERFENSSISYMGSDFELLPFGGGRRICPGIAFGVGIIENALANLLFHFDWELPNGLKPHEIDMTEAMVLSNLPKIPLQVVPIPLSQQK